MENGHTLPPIGSERAERLAALKSLYHHNTNYNTNDNTNTNNNTNYNTNSYYYKDNTFWPTMVSCPLLVLVVAPFASVLIFWGKCGGFSTCSRRRRYRIMHIMPNWTLGCAGSVSVNSSGNGCSTSSRGASRRMHQNTNQIHL